MTINRNLSILASGVSSTGVLGVPNGGSGATTLTGYLIGNGTGAFTASATIPTTALSGTVTNTQLTNSAITINGTSTSLGGSISVGTVTSVAATVPAFLSIAGSPITTSGTLAITLSGTALPVANGGTGVTTSTGSVNNVLSTSPTLTTPIISTTLGVGGTTPSASGSGISFPATQSASTDVNTLDDYEEGTWTPTGIGVTFASASGKYVKIGKAVYISFNITWPVNSAGNQAGFSGFPFASDGTAYAYTKAKSTYTLTMNIASPGYAGTASGTLLYNNGDTAITDAAMSTLTLSGSGFYFTS